MPKQKITLAKENPKDFSLHLPDNTLTEKDIEDRFKNLKSLLRKFQSFPPSKK